MSNPAAVAVRTERAERAERVSRAELDYRPTYLAAGIASLLVLVLYLLTLAPSTAMWDTSEYIAAAKVLGLPHPPGNPFFVLLGHVFGLLPIAPNYAMRINILAAVSSAIAAGAWFLIAERVLVSWLPQRWQRVTGGALASLLGATAFTVWNQSVVNEKVYTVALAIFAIVAWLTVRWCDEPEGRKGDRLLVLIAYLLGLGYANHPAGFLPAPAVGLAVLATAWTRGNWAMFIRWRLILAVAGAMLLGMSPFISQPIRSAHFPAINEGETTGCTVKIAVDCTLSAKTVDRFMYNFNRGQYGKPPLAERQAPYSAQIGMWWLYFKWQWIRDAHGTHAFWQTLLAVVFLLLGFVGGWVHWLRDRRSFYFFGPLVFTLTLALIYYLNFKYGASQAPDLQDVPREVRDRDYFFLWSFSTWSVWAALGLVWVWESIAAALGSEPVRVGRETIDVPRRDSWFKGAPILALALVPLFANWSSASRAKQTDTRDFAADLLNSVEPYGVLVTVGDNDTFPLWYAQEVEGIRKDVIVANTSLLNTDWYTRQILRRPVYEYDAARGPAIYRGQQWKKPSGPPVKMTMDQMDSLPLYVPLQSPQLFRVAGTGLNATIDPRQLQNGVIERADIMVLQMIKDAWPERPVYFSRTAGNYGQTLGLQPYLLTQGLARKLLPQVPTPGRDTIIIPGEGFVDVARTEKLWNEVFQAPNSLIRRGDWIDQPSVGIPYLYVQSGIMLGEALNNTGRPQEGAKVLQTAEKVAQAMRLGDVFASVRQQRPTPPAVNDSASPTAIPLGRP